MDGKTLRNSPTGKLEPSLYFLGGQLGHLSQSPGGKIGLLVARMLCQFTFRRTPFAKTFLLLCPCLSSGFNNAEPLNFTARQVIPWTAVVRFPTIG